MKIRFQLPPRRRAWGPRARGRAWSGLIRPGLALFAGAVVAGRAAAQTADRPGPVRSEWRTDFESYTVHPDSLVRFGPRDAIPALSDPAFESQASASAWLEGREPVVVVSVRGDTRAYPVQILMQHDVVNDVVGGTPVAVTFCLLCGSAIAYDRRFDGQVLEFGVAGVLHNSNVVIYDRQTETFWAQAVGSGLVGRYAGSMLDFLYAPTLPFAEFRSEYPDAPVLSRETGYDRDYGRGRLLDYEDRGPLERFFRRDVDVRLPAKERVLVIDREGEQVAFPFRALTEQRVLEATVAGEPVVAFWAPGTASIYSERTADGADVGAAVGFSPVVDGERLRFRPYGEDRFRDRETATVWSLSGLATEGPLAGRRLRQVDEGVHFWFAWAAYRPRTRVVER